MRKIPEVAKITWFPGHMHRATNQLLERVKDMDVFIEIRDSRLPYSSMNYELDDIIKTARKKKIVIFNKYDLCNHQVTLKAIDNLRKLGVHGFPTSAINKVNLRKLVETSHSVLPPKFDTSVGAWMLIGGMPNIGKSTIINKLRQQAPKIRGNYITKVSKTASETRHLKGFRISDKPNSWLIDTPGLMVPSVIENDMAVKLSLVGCIKDKILGPDLLVELLYEFFKIYNQKEYVRYYELRYEPRSAKEWIDMLRNRFLEMDEARTCTRILDDFRAGRLGKITLDDIDFL